MMTRISKLWPVRALFLVVGCLTLFAAQTHAADAPWSAQWIGPENAGTNTWICYRKSFDVAQVPTGAVARIAVDSKYWLWINGKQVVFEGGLKRGPTPKDTYYDEVDLAAYLKPGQNTVAVLAWYWGKNGFSHNSSGKAGFILEADVNGKKLLTDGTWKVRIHPAYGTSEAPSPNYRLAESNVFFDARKDDGDWTAPRYDDAAWGPASLFGLPPVAPWNELEKRPVLQWKNSGLVSYVNVERTKDSNGNQVIIGKLPYNAQITPYLKIESAAGRVIDVRTDDYKGGGEFDVRGIYITKDGLQEYESLGWMNGHSVQYTLPADVKVLEIKYRETGYNADFVGEFQCDDEALNVLWQKARRTLYITMRDNYMDCPDRERAQWWGDMVNELGEAFYVFDAVKGPMLARKGIFELARWQRSDNTLYAPVPSGIVADGVRPDRGNGTWNMELPPQMLASVGKYGFWTYYFYTGDRKTMAAVYPHVRDYLKVWQLDANGLVIHRKGDWDWEDWGENIDAQVMDSAWYYLALQGAVKMARLCGVESDIDEWQGRMKSIEGGFNARFWTGKEYRSAEYKGDTDDRANALAVVAGLAGPDKFEALREVFAKHRNASPYMEKYVLEALYLMHAPDEAMARMRERWKTQIASWTTTLWEGWGLGAEGYGGGTYNHAWSGGALTVLSQYGAGVAPDEAGFEKYHVMPQMGSLKSIRSVVATPHGNITIDLRKDASLFTATLKSPEKTSALLSIPVPPGKNISRMEVNGKTTWTRSGGPGEAVDGVAFASASEDYVSFNVQPGAWVFKATFE